MNTEDLKRRVSSILRNIEDESIPDGMDILSAAISSVLISAMASGMLKPADVHDYFSELERRISKTFKREALQIQRKKGS